MVTGMEKKTEKVTAISSSTSFLHVMMTPRYTGEHHQLSTAPTLNHPVTIIFTVTARVHHGAVRA